MSRQSGPGLQLSDRTIEGGSVDAGSASTPDQAGLRDDGEPRTGAGVSESAGRVVLVGTPVGNPLDASDRLRQLIETADVIAAEDTRRFRRLAADLGVRFHGQLVSFYESVEREKVGYLISAAQAGQLVVLVTDAGMPSISDPGYRLVAECRQHSVPVSVAPGPSAVTAALTVSGLASDRFCFEGFLPRKSGERLRRLADVVDEPRTMVFFEAPHRISDTLAAMAEVFGADRQAVVCRELTKTHEETKAGSLVELVDWAKDGLRGEITIVVAGADEPEVDTSPEALNLAVQAVIDSGTDKKSAIAQVARNLKIPKRQVYDAVLAQRSQP